MRGARCERQTEVGSGPRWGHTFDLRGSQGVGSKEWGQAFDLHLGSSIFGLNRAGYARAKIEGLTPGGIRVGSALFTRKVSGGKIRSRPERHIIGGPMRQVVIAIICAAVAGCAPINHPISMGGLQEPAHSFVVDQTPPDTYPGFLAGEGLDLSCRYGIHHQSLGEFSPPKVQLFAGLLATALPSITSHKVVLQRFDVYYNHRLKALHILGSGGLGGIVGGMIADSHERSFRQNMDVFVLDRLLIDTKPDVDRHPGENQVGCGNRHEGEYYASEISGGHDVVVTWLKFTVDDRPYYFRTFYQFQPDSKVQIAEGIKDALQMSVKGIAPQLQF